MAPEVINGKHYDSSADIWSFGITAIELTQGRPPRSRESSHKVLLQTVQDAPPAFSRTGGDGQMTFSRAFAEMVESCLCKDPAARPTAAQLLASPFFKTAKKESFLVGKILKGLPPLARRQERVKADRHRTLASVESWDFAATLASHPGSPTSTHFGHSSHPSSPTTTHFRRPHSLLIAEDKARKRSGSASNSIRGGACTPLSERPERDREASGGSTRHSIARSSAWRDTAGSRNHSRNVSWMEHECGEPLIFPVDAPLQDDEEASASGDDIAHDAPLDPTLAPSLEVISSDTQPPRPSSPPRSPPLKVPAAQAAYSPALAVPALSGSPSSSSSGPSPLATPKSPLALLRSRSPGDAVSSSAPFSSISPIQPTASKPPRVARMATSPSSSPMHSPTTASSSSLWRKLRGKGSEDRRASNSSDKEKRKAGFMGSILSRTASGGGAARGKLERAQSERG